MRNAALLVGIWLGIILFAYSVVYLQLDNVTRLTPAGDAETVDEANGFALRIPVGWSLISIAAGAELTAPVAGVEAWALYVAAQTVEEALATAWEVLDPCSSCGRPAILESTPLDDGRNGFSVALAVDVEGRTSRAVVLFQGEAARVLLVRLTGEDSLPDRVRSELARIEAGFRAAEIEAPLPEPLEAPAPSEPAEAPST